MKKKLVIFGTGEIANITFEQFKNYSDYEVVSFAVDKKYIKGENFNNLPLIPFEEIENKYDPKNYFMHVALSYREFNKLREKKYISAKQKGFQLASFVSEQSNLSKNIRIGENCFILENQTVQTGVVIEDNVVMWSSNHIGHETHIGKHTYISSHVVISGHCKIGERCFFGVNSAVADFTSIGSDSFITMGSNINTNLKEGSTTINSGTKILNDKDPLSIRIKKKYFKL